MLSQEEIQGLTRQGISDAACAHALETDGFYSDEFGSAEACSQELTEAISTGAEYQGRKVTLNKPFRTPDGPKKFGVYVKNDKGKVILVRFGSKELSIKKDDPKRRKAFFDRFGKDRGPKWKAKYWAMWAWEKETKLP